MDQLILPFVFDATVHTKASQQPSNGSAAAIIPFPSHRDGKLVDRLAAEFIRLRERHGRRCRPMLLSKRFKPIGNRLRGMGVPAATVEVELARLEKAVARVVWITDGRPACDSGGGSVA